MLQVEKALESVEEEATQFYKEERGNIVEDEPSAVRDMMYVFLLHSLFGMNFILVQ
jgi:hypothetical protein